MLRASPGRAGAGLPRGAASTSRSEPGHVAHQMRIGITTAV